MKVIQVIWNNFICFFVCLFFYNMDVKGNKKEQKTQMLKVEKSSRRKGENKAKKYLTHLPVSWRGGCVSLCKKESIA